MKRCSVILALLLAWCWPVPAPAEILPTFPLHELSIRAKVVVLVKPIQPTQLDRFRILEVIRGKNLKPGDTITLSVDSTYRLQLLQQKGTKRKPRKVAQALLFLDSVGAWKGNTCKPVLSGLRFWTEKGRVFVPEQFINPGPYVLVERPRARWDVLYKQTQKEVAEVDRLLDLKRHLPLWQRNQRILRWIRVHGREFGRRQPGPRGGEETWGWGSLEEEVFRWVLDGGEPRDAWRAVQLFAELYNGHVPPLQGPVFGTDRGRALLTRIVFDHNRLMGDRVRALKLLTHPQTLWPNPDADRGVTAITPRAQAALLKKILPLLGSKNPQMRMATSRAIRLLTVSGTRALSWEACKHASTALVAAYERSVPGPLRGELAEAIYTVGGPNAWQKLSGNPPGLLVRLHDLEQKNQQVHFWLSMRTQGQKVYEQPRLVLRRIRFGLVFQRKELLVLANQTTPNWKDGWSGTPYLLIRFVTSDLTPGTWRVRVDGTVGKGKDQQKWRSDSWTIRVARVKKPQTEPPSPYLPPLDPSP